MTSLAPHPDGDRTALPVRGRPAPLITLLIASTLTVMAGAVLSPVLELIRRDLALDATGAGLLFTAHGLSLAAASPVWGRIVDRHGVRIPLAAGLLIYGLAGGSGLVLDDYAALLAGRLLFGIGAAAVFTASTVALLSYYRGTDLDRVMGWRVTAASAGGVVWPLLAGVAGGLSWHGPFALYLAGVPLGLAVLWALPRTPARPPQPRPAAAAAGAGPRNRALAGWLALSGANAMLLYAAVVFLPMRLAEAGVEAPFAVALISITVSVAGSVGGLRYAAAKRRFGFRGVLRIAASGWLATFLLLAVAAEAVLIVLALAVYGVGLGLAMPALTTLINESAPPARRARATALSGTTIFAGQFLAPVLIGPVVDSFGMRAGYLTAAAVAAVVLAVVFRRGLPAAGRPGPGEPVAGAGTPRTEPPAGRTPRSPGAGSGGPEAGSAEAGGAGRGGAEPGSAGAAAPGTAGPTALAAAR